VDLGLNTLHIEPNDVVPSMDNLAELNPRLLVPRLLSFFCLQLVSNCFSLSRNLVHHSVILSGLTVTLLIFLAATVLSRLLSTSARVVAGMYRQGGER
jgi:hypothetical protein